MVNKLKNLFKKNDDDKLSLLDSKVSQFVLKIDETLVATLCSKNGEWHFKYSPEFKRKRKGYRKIMGFPDIDKEYVENFLWPFFKTRIPSLKQPLVRDIIKKEKIEEDEASLLQRFGEKSISNPYTLECV